MEINSVSGRKYSWSDTFRSKLKEYECMHEYFEEPDIFDFGSEKFKDFLLHSLANINSDFHYLSFLNEEDIDQELCKVLEILQIYCFPVNCRKSGKLFDNFGENEIYKLWSRLFFLFSINNDEQFTLDNTFLLKSETKFFTSMSSISHYLSYNFPVIDPKKVSKINIDEEIAMWRSKVCCNTEISLIDSSINESVTDPNLNFDIEKLVADLKRFIAAAPFKLKADFQESIPEYCNSLKNLVSLCKDVLQYKNNLNEINIGKLSICINDYLTFCNNHNSMNNLCFLKSFLNQVKILKKKIDSLVGAP